MKMTKKLILATVAIAAVIGFASCKQTVGDVKFNDKGTGTGSQIVTVKQTNENDHTIRGLKQLDLTKRAQATCIVEQYNQTNKTNDGMVGFITFYSENKKDKAAENYGTINFLVVGVKNNCGKTQTYASYYCNIKKDKLSTSNFGVADKDTYTEYKADLLRPFEVVIVDLPGADTPGVSKVGNVNGVTFDKDGTLKMAIEFTGNKDGSIDINWYKDWNETAASQAAAKIDFTGKTPVYTATASAAQIGNEVDPDDPTSKAKKGFVYAYANIYKKQTLNAKWQLCNVSWSMAGFADEELMEVGDIIFE